MQNINKVPSKLSSQLTVLQAGITNETYVAQCSVRVCLNVCVSLVELQ